VRNPVLREALTGGGRVHVIGLVSDGGVHASMDHLRALIEMAGAQGAGELIVHAFTDGRDTSPHGGAAYLGAVESWMADAGVGRIGSVIGRYYAMDRDRRWDRVQRAYDLLVRGAGEHRAPTGAAACEAAYAREETDEFIAATVVGDEDSRIRPDDSVIGLNFRPDRMREITLALCDAGCDDIDRGDAGLVTRYATMAEYDASWSFPVAFAPQRPPTTIGAVIAARGGRQLHVAETEKYPHVTYFFNGGEEVPYDGEDRELVDSPRNVATYDAQPEMSAPAAARAFIDTWRGGDFRFGIINFANADMVGHTGVIPAAVRAVETVDRYLGEVVDAVVASGGALLITADHGNADHMRNDDGSPNTAHSLNPVPVIVTVDGVTLRDGGVLADVAPTLLTMLGEPQPDAMSGRSLIV
jgi:2,3-bisphosphoglycerate-independent phosphoglycerate mutase